MTHMLPMKLNELMKFLFKKMVCNVSNSDSKVLLKPQLEKLTSALYTENILTKMIFHIEIFPGHKFSVVLYH